MNSRINGRLAAIMAFGLATAALAGAPVQSEAQSRVDRQIERAMSHEAKAEDQSQQKNRWDQAAWNYRRAASLRPHGDPIAVENLERAGRLSYYIRDMEQSVTDLERAANMALDGGNIVTAAHLLTDAAWVASSVGMGERAQAMVDRARLLAAAPVFSEQERGAVLTRLSNAGIDAPVLGRTAGR